MAILDWFFAGIILFIGLALAAALNFASSLIRTKDEKMERIGDAIVTVVAVLAITVACGVYISCRI